MSIIRAKAFKTGSSTMGKKRQQTRLALRETAAALAIEFHRGDWDHLPDLKNRPMGKLTELFDELEKRCPGHSRDRYSETFQRALWNNR